MNRKFIKNGYQWGTISKKNKCCIRSRHLKKPHLISRSRNHDFELLQDDNLEETIEENDEYHSNYKITFLEDSYEETDGYHTNYKITFLEDKIPILLTNHQIVVKEIKKGNTHILKQFLNCYNFKSVFKNKCHLCMTADKDIQQYLIVVENASPCKCGIYCGGYQQYIQNKLSIHVPRLTFKQHHKIKQLYYNECPLCITMDTKIHQFMVDEFAIKACRKYDCLGYDQYIFSKEFAEILSLLFSISRHNHKKLFIDKNLVLGEILYLTTQMLDDTFRELLSYMHLTPLPTTV